MVQSWRLHRSGPLEAGDHSVSSSWCEETVCWVMIPVGQHILWCWHLMGWWSSCLHLPCILSCTHTDPGLLCWSHSLHSLNMTTHHMSSPLKEFKLIHSFFMFLQGVPKRIIKSAFKFFKNTESWIRYFFLGHPVHGWEIIPKQLLPSPMNPSSHWQE